VVRVFNFVNVREVVGPALKIKEFEVKLHKQLFKSAFKKYMFLLALVFFAAAGAVGYNMYRNNQIAEAATCDSNNIANKTNSGGYCGANASNIYSVYNSLDGVGKSAFNHAGIKSSEFNNLKPCVIWRSGDVSIGNDIVATGANTYGRQDINRPGIGGSTQVPGGSWVRPTNVSYASGVNSLQGFCRMDGKEFKWGVINVCGNPVKATPKFKNNPKGTLTKTVSKPEVKVGEVFTYTLTLKNIGNVDLQNVVLKDLLPAGIVMANGAPGNPRIFEFGTVKAGEAKVVKLEVKAVSGVVYDAQLRNLACFTSNYNTNIPICDDAFVIVRKKEEPKKPDIKIEKDVSTAVPVEVGEPFTYTIKVTNTGQVDLKNAKIVDTLPAGVVATSNPNSRTINFNIPLLKVGESKTFSFQAKVVEGPATDVKLINTACVETDEIPNKKCDDAPIEVKKPKFACTALQVATTDADQQLPFNVTFTAQGTASNGAVIEGYIWNFGDGQNQTTPGNQVNHGYNAYGNFTATVQVKTNKGTTPVSAACSKTIEVKETPKTPVYTCDGLTINKLTDRKYTFTTSYTAQNGAVLKNIAYNFGDQTPVVNTLQTTVEHEYAEVGEYTASAILTFTVNGEDKVVASENCKATTDKPPVIPVCPYNPALPKDSPDCKPDVPVVPETPVTPETPMTVLPDTGAGSIIGIFAATTAAGMIAYRLIWLRKFNG
jgi:uncharacterized repeat protein (TIGR01451 family)